MALLGLDGFEGGPMADQGFSAIDRNVDLEKTIQWQRTEEAISFVFEPGKQQWQPKISQKHETVQTSLELNMVLDGVKRFGLQHVRCF